ncbi:hypothetical protein B0H19DRAFT_1069029 [Mycena capillaripes]|nr:hypothetical protein B0H19DRAFT_1069029 [Mycena capillaripes]
MTTRRLWSGAIPNKNGREAHGMVVPVQEHNTAALQQKVPQLGFRIVNTTRSRVGKKPDALGRKTKRTTQKKAMAQPRVERGTLLNDDNDYGAKVGEHEKSRKAHEWCKKKRDAEERKGEKKLFGRGNGSAPSSTSLNYNNIYKLRQHLTYPTFEAHKNGREVHELLGKSPTQSLEYARGWNPYGAVHGSAELNFTQLQYVPSGSSTDSVKLYTPPDLSHLRSTRKKAGKRTVRVGFI